jgi:hypothetical protein
MLVLRSKYVEALLYESMSFIDESCKLLHKREVIEALGKLCQVLPHVRSTAAGIESGAAVIDVATLSSAWRKILLAACRTLVPVFVEKSSDESLHSMRATVCTRCNRMTVAELKAMLMQRGIPDAEIPGIKKELAAMCIDVEVNEHLKKESATLQKFSDATQSFREACINGGNPELSSALDTVLDTISGTEPGDFVTLCQNPVTYTQDAMREAFRPRLRNVVLVVMKSQHLDKQPLILKCFVFSDTPDFDSDGSRLSCTLLQHLATCSRSFLS